MKYTQNFLILIICLLFSCQKEEQLNLIPYPQSNINIISDTESSQTKINATYNSDGKLEFSNPVRQTWNITLSTPSPKDVQVSITPFGLNIPTENIDIEPKSIIIPAGYTSTSVEIGLKNDDFSFMESEIQEKDYELGIELTNPEGVNIIQTENIIKKITINKEKYISLAQVIGEQGNHIQLKRVYQNGNIIGDDIQYTFKIQLDKPAIEDLEINFSTSGIPEEFKEDAVFSPEKIKIPKGNSTSENITWSISNDFLKIDDQDAMFNISLTANLMETETAAIDNKQQSIDIELEKTTSLLELVDGTQSDWNSIDRTNWEVELGEGWTGNKNDVIDNYLYTSIKFIELEEGKNTGTIIFDLSKECNVKGFWASYNKYSTGYPSYTEGYYIPIITEIQISTDKQTWDSLGCLDTSNSKDRHYIKFAIPITARYVKFIGTCDPELAMIEVQEIKLYE